MSIYM